MAYKKLKKILLYCLYVFLGLAAVWLLFKFALPWLLPFLIALIVARLMEPAVVYLSKQFRFKRGFSSAVCALVFLSITISLIVLIVWRASYELAAFVRELPTLLAGTSSILATLEEKLDGWIKAVPPEIQNYIQSVIDNFAERSAALPSALSAWLIAAVSSIAAYAPKLTVFALTTAIAIFFISSRYHEIAEFLARQVPENKLKAMRDFKSDIRSTLGKWLKAQLILCGITAAELSVAFFIMRIDYAVLLALLVALIDALPVIGSGTVLIPWALSALLSGNTGRAVILIVTYAVVSIVRSGLEPKLVGGQLGLPPIATLAAFYIGFSVFGVAGMVLFPILLIFLKQFNDRGYIKLWK